MFDLSQNGHSNKQQYLTWSIETNSIPGNISVNCGMGHHTEVNQVPPTYSVLQYIGRVATPKLVPRNYLRYLQTTLIMEIGRLVSEFMWGIEKILIFWGLTKQDLSLCSWEYLFTVTRHLSKICTVNFIFRNFLFSNSDLWFFSNQF